jgi:hypothetical protein
MRMFRITAFFVASCSATLAAVPSATQIDSVSLERTTCYGTCPAYTVTIRRDGKVTYRGKDFVKVTGHRTRKISANEFQKLTQEIERIGFFSFKAEYSHKVKPDGSIEYISDMPTTFTTVRAGKLRKRVEDYYGGPDSLARLEKLIDSVAGSSAWTGVSK